MALRGRGCHDAVPTFSAMRRMAVSGHDPGMTCRIAFVLFPGFQQLDLAGPMAVFEVARLQRPGSYAWRLVASQAPAVRSFAGVHWPTGPLPRRLDGIDLVMVIGGDGVDAACRDRALITWLQRASRTGARMASICSGSLVLAAAGLPPALAARVRRTLQLARPAAAVRRAHPRARAAGGGGAL